jgi:uncharacterized membrane protein YgcG
VLGGYFDEFVKLLGVTAIIVRRESLSINRSRILTMSLVVVLLVFICFIYGISAGSVEYYLPKDIPNPMTNPQECNRNVAHSAVCDPNKLLSLEGANVIEGEINEIKTAEVAVLIIKKMDPSFISYRNKEAAAELFAKAIHNAWGVGDATTNNGVLIFLSIDDRALYISIGSGVRNILTPTVVDITIENMKSYLRTKTYDGALEYAVTDISLYLDGKKAAPVSYDGYLFGGFTAIFLAVAAGAYFENRRKKSLTRGNTKLEDLAREASSMDDETYKSKSCPICLEDFPFPPEDRGQSDQKLGEDPASPLLSKVLNRPMALKCGHIFCFTCLDLHLKSANGNRCPICRKNVDGTDAPPGTGTNRPPRPPCSPSTQQEASSTEYTQFRSSELLYRVNRMRYLYPAVMTVDTHRNMEDSINRGDYSALRRFADERSVAVQLIVTDIERREASMRSGSSGSSRSSFGGGRSSGGRGGSW